MTESVHKRARILCDLGRNSAARELLGPALASEPDNARLHAMLGYAWLRDKKPLPAREATRIALRHDPTDVFALWVLATCENELAYLARDPHLRAHHTGAAIATAIRTVELGRDQADSHRLLAQVCRKRDRGLALRAITTALELDPDDASNHIEYARVVWTGLSDVSSRAGGAAAAGRRALETALRLEPDNSEALLLLGSADATANEWETAEPRIRRATELNPDYAPEARKTLALRFASKEKSKAPLVIATIAALVTMHAFVRMALGDGSEPSTPSPSTTYPTPSPTHYRPSNPPVTPPMPSDFPWPSDLVPSPRPPAPTAQPNG
ncbi:tetratricopeptide repeat protein [Nocardia asteroides]|uniref:tetratricopeptide repeat protein n=1 Tax=Nocardia asteroides TaxID=1824 RepID=UPI003446D1BE